MPKSAERIDNFTDIEMDKFIKIILFLILVCDSLPI